MGLTGFIKTHVTPPGSSFGLRFRYRVIPNPSSTQPNKKPIPQPQLTSQGFDFSPFRGIPKPYKFQTLPRIMFRPQSLIFAADQLEHKYLQKTLYYILKLAYRMINMHLKELITACSACKVVKIQPTLPPSLQHQPPRPILPKHPHFILLQHPKSLSREVGAVNFLGVEDVRRSSWLRPRTCAHPAACPDEQ